MRPLSLALVLAAAAMAQEKRFFSHPPHLALKLECKDCHAAALASKDPTDNLLPAREMCAKCHKNALVSPPKATKLAHFSHAQHLQIGNVAPLIARAIDTGRYLLPATAALRKSLDTNNVCLACHRDVLGEAPAHDAMRRMADCLVCHNQIAPPDSCERCHGSGAALKPATHTASFLDTHSGGNAKLDKSTCAVCHGRNFTCLGCH